MPRGLATFAYAIFVRMLGVIAGLITGYGATGMFTSGGIMPPNGLVNVGLLASVIVAFALWSRERRLEGMWSVLLIPAALYAAYGIASFASAECEPPYGPITPQHVCEPVGSHAIGLLAPILFAFAFWMLVRDVRGLARIWRPTA